MARAATVEDNRRALQRRWCSEKGQNHPIASQLTMDAPPVANRPVRLHLRLSPERNGYIERLADLEDRRRVLVDLTPEAQAVLNRLLPTLARVRDAIAAAPDGLAPPIPRRIPRTLRRSSRRLNTTVSLGRSRTMQDDLGGALQPVGVDSEKCCVDYPGVAQSGQVPVISTV